MDQRIVLDEKSFKALSADSRVSILKSLGERRRTLSELSHRLNLGTSTIKEHCDILSQAELIRQIDEGRKWKYYELTQKGRQIINPNLLDEVKVLIILCLGVIMIGGIVFFAIQFFTLGATSYTQASAEAPMLKNTIIEANSIARDMNAEVGEAITTSTPGSTNAQCIIQTMQGTAPEFFMLGTVIAVMLGILFGWIIARRN